MMVTTIPVPTPYPIAFSVNFVTNVTSAITTKDNVFFDHYESAITNEATIIEKNRNEDHHWDHQQHPQSRNDDDPTFAIGGKLFYDWKLRSQRIDHEGGSYECVHFYQTDLACSLYFLPQGGMYRIIHHDHDNEYNNDDDEHDNRMERKDSTKSSVTYGSTDVVDCCLDLSNIHTIPPDWASHAVNSTYNGIVWDDYSQLWAMQWSFDHIETASDKRIETLPKKEIGVSPHDIRLHQHESFNEGFQANSRRTNRRYLRDKQSSPRVVASSSDAVPDVSSMNSLSQAQEGTTSSTTYDCHTVREVAFGENAGKPLVFTFPGAAAMGRQDYHYDIYSLIEGPQDPSVFELPPDCLERACQ